MKAQRHIIDSARRGATTVSIKTTHDFRDRVRTLCEHRRIRVSDACKEAVRKYAEAVTKNVELNCQTSPRYGDLIAHLKKKGLVNPDHKTAREDIQLGGHLGGQTLDELDRVAALHNESRRTVLSRALWRWVESERMRVGLPDQLRRVEVSSAPYRIQDDKWK